MAVSNGTVGTKKHAGGRPPIIIKDLYIDPLLLVEHLSSIWCTNEELALCLGVSSRTVSRAKNRQPEFSQALKRGEESANCSLVRKAKKLVDDGNVVMTIFSLKNKCGWTDRREVKHDGDSTSVTVINQPERPVIKKHDTVPAMQGDAGGNGGGDNDVL